MQAVLTALEMATADKAAIELLHTGQTRLMELAGRECARVIAETCTGGGSLKDSSFLVVCGKGNNGGDGFVVARHLLNQGALVDLLLIYPESELNAVCVEGLDILKAYRRYNEKLRIFRSHNEALPFVAEWNYDGVIDGLLGTGLRIQERLQPLQNPLGETIELINSINERCGALTIAIDIPSGLDATSGFMADPAVRADVTVTMAFLKTGFFFNDGPDLAGTIKVAEISIPEFIVEPCQCMLTDEEFAAEHYLLREPGSAKHTNGKVLLIAGSKSEQGSMIGAAMLSAKASVKTGAGYVCSSLPLEAAPAMHGFAPEVIVVGRSMESVIEKVMWADTLVIGCGLGREEGTMDFIEALLLHPEVARKKVVIDADALYAIGERQLLEKGLDMSNTILTPHRGEFSRLCGRTVEEIGLHPMEITREFASRWKVNILLKGSPTIVCSPSGTVLLNDSGTEALATAGSGDVLAGMIGAISAKGVEIVAAAAAAAWLHGRAGDLASDVSSLVSSADLLNAIPLALSELFTVGEL